jgi:hypothetical protein
MIGLIALLCVPLAFLFSVGCCCEPGCDICADDFTRSDSSDIDTGSSCGWTEAVGSWDISSNTLRSTGGGSNALAICDTPHPDGDTTMVVEAWIKHSTNGSACDLIVNYVDSSNYFYVRYNFAASNGGSIDIRKNVAGTHSSIISQPSLAINAGSTYVARVCVTESGAISAYWQATGETIATPRASTPSAQGMTGTKCGFGSNGTGTATFDNFVFSRGYHADHAPDCEACRIACGGCVTDTVAMSYQCVVSGSTYFDGTYLVEYASTCVYDGDGPGVTSCNANDFDKCRLLLWVGINPNIRFAISSDDFAGAGTIQWGVNPGVPPYDCAPEGGRILPRYFNPTGCFVPLSSTCTVTAV